jgi:hypothetical protein
MGPALPPTEPVSLLPRLLFRAKNPTFAPFGARV